MKLLYKDILESVHKGNKLLAILIDPDKMMPEGISGFFQSVNNSIITHVFVGGSTVNDEATEVLVLEIKKHTHLPIILFPGDVTQITENADALLFLSLISGNNPKYLVEKQVEAVSKLRGIQLEIIPTGYILIENGKETSVQKVTRTQPMVRSNIQQIVDTAKAGELLGMKLIYLEAGSGATHPITDDIISAVKQDLEIPLIVGGGIKSNRQLEMAFKAGADLVVIGTAIEEDSSFLAQLK